MSRIPGWVLPGPFGSLVSVAAVVGVVLADAVADGDGAGVWFVAGETLGIGVVLATAGADRGNAGASRKTVIAETQRPATKITPIARRSPVGNGRRTTVILSTAAPPGGDWLTLLSGTRRPSPPGPYITPWIFWVLRENDEYRGGVQNVVTKHAARWSKLGLLVAGILALAGITISPSYAANNTEIYIVQGLPGKNLDVEIDGKSIATGVKTATVAGPFKVDPGKRMVTFKENGSTILKNTFSIKEGSKADVVAHLPASSSGDPLVTVYKYDDVKVPKGKALLVVSHVAAVPPADIRVNDQVLFANIANGESLELIVPVATYKVSIVPTGKKKPVYFGPVSLTVKGEAINRVYAVGDPEKKTMNVCVHVLTAGERGSGKPSEVNTGNGGQAVGDGPSFGVNFAR